MTGTMQASNPGGMRGASNGASVRFARKAALQATTAVALALMATAAHAQCSATGRPTPGVPGNPFLDLTSTVSGIQSLVGVLSTQNTAFLTQTSSFVGAPANPTAYTNGGGVWVRGVGGTFDTAVPGNVVVNPGPIFGASSGSCDATRAYQSYTGFQTGADISRLNIDGWNIHTGVTMGYTESRVTTNQTFSADFQTPFVGVYAAATKGQFFLDGQARWDFFQGRLSDPSNLLLNQRLDARSWSINGNVGYQIPFNDGWFIEPSAGAVYSQVSVDRLQTGGNIFLANPPNFGAPLSIKIRDFESILGRASLRFGKNYVVGSYGVQPFVTASVISEFGDPVRTNFSTDFAAYGSTFGINLAGFDSSGVVNTYRIKTYGQFSAGVAGQVLNTGWVGYFRGDYRTGDRVEGWGLSAGLRYQFNPGVAATPLITKGDSPSFLPVIDGPVNWSGLSVGGSVGGLWGQSKQEQAGLVFDDIERVKPRVAGVYVGGQVGYDYQVGNIVLGVAGDAGFANAKGGRGCASDFDGNLFNCQTNVDALYMATGRVGYAFDRTLLYVKGGAAFADTSEKQQNNFANQPTFLQQQFGVVLGDSNVKAVSAGWTVGAGFEYALNKNWSAKAEYLHYQLDRENYARVNSAVAPNSAFVSAQHSGDIVKVGVNYRFNFDPVAVAPAAVVAKN